MQLVTEWQLWSPHTAADINRIEDIQRKFTARIDGLRDLNYRQRLRELKMYSQERRRDRYAVIFIWKIAMGLVDGYPLEFIQQQRDGEGSVMENP